MYQALYRKYRPQTFSDVVGQKSVTDNIIHIIVQDQTLLHAPQFAKHCLRWCK